LFRFFCLRWAKPGRTRSTWDANAKPGSPLSGESARPWAGTIGFNDDSVDFFQRPEGGWFDPMAE
jgi:hypothetical protein